MSAAEKLQALISVKEELKAQYDGKIKALETRLSESEKKQATLQATIAQQIEKISELTSASSQSRNLEQLNRELTNRCEKLQAEINTQKVRSKTMQKELGDAREEVKQLKQFDAEKMRKNLAETKKKLVEKTEANDLINKTIIKVRSENAELKKKMEEMEKELNALKPAPAESEAEAEVVKTEEAA